MLLFNRDFQLSRLGIPEITKDSASEANYSEEDDPTRRSRGMPPQHHGPHHRYGPQMDPQGPPGAHRSPSMGGPSSRPQDPYYDQTGRYNGHCVAVMEFFAFYASISNLTIISYSN